MINRVIQHEVKLEKSVKIILAVLAIGVCANAFAPTFGIKEALAELSGGESFNVGVSGELGCSYGCK